MRLRQGSWAEAFGFERQNVVFRLVFTSFRVWDCQITLLRFGSRVTKSKTFASDSPQLPNRPYWCGLERA